MFHLHIRLVPVWPDLEYLDTLTGDAEANIQFRPDVRRRSTLLNESIDYLFDPLPLDIVQSHVIAT